MNRATTLQPRRVLCVIEHAHRDLDVAEAACNGRFTLAGITLELGPEPDWLGAELPKDEEWQIEWTKFYYGLDLAHAFATTGEHRYLTAWERLVRSYIRQVPLGALGIDTSDVVARRTQNWIYAWSAFAAAPGYPGLADGLEDELLESLHTQIRHIRDNLTAERNHRTLELYALLIAALALPQLDPDGALLDLAVAELHANLLTDIREDGVHREHSTHYHLIALRSFLGASENLRRIGRSFPPEYDARLNLACDFALHCHRPDGVIPALSDSDNGSYPDVLALGAGVLDRADLKGALPAHRLASFPAAGYWMQRSGWNRDDRFLIFDCGPVGDGGHGHYDLLSIEAMAGGRPLIVDPGRCTYSEHPPNLRHWFKGTAAHNTVMVDGLEQIPYRRGKPKKDTHSQARFLERLSAPGLDILHGEARSVSYDAVHRRQVIFVADAYWLILDEMESARPHRYDLRFHLHQSAWGHTYAERAGDAWAVRAPGLALMVLGEQEPTIEDGLVAPEYGIPLDAPVASVVRDGASSVSFATLLLPQPDVRPLPVVRFERDGDRWELLVTCGDVSDHVVWRAVSGELGLGPFPPQGRARWLRSDAAGSIAASVVTTAATWSAWDRETGERTGDADTL